MRSTESNRRRLAEQLTASRGLKHATVARRADLPPSEADLTASPASTAGASEDRNVSWCRRGPRHVQAELSRVERPDLAVLVDAKDQRLVRRIKVESDQSVTLAAKFLSRETFKVSTSCGLRPCAHQIRRTLL